MDCLGVMTFLWRHRNLLFWKQMKNRLPLLSNSPVSFHSLLSLARFLDIRYHCWDNYSQWFSLTPPLIKKKKQLYIRQGLWNQVENESIWYSSLFAFFEPMACLLDKISTTELHSQVHLGMEKWLSSLKCFLLLQKEAQFSALTWPLAKNL